MCNTCLQIIECPIVKMNQICGKRGAILSGSRFELSSSSIFLWHVTACILLSCSSLVQKRDDHMTMTSRYLSFIMKMFELPSPS